MGMNQTMIVTGGGRGIGAATTLLAAERGYAVVIGYARDEAAATTVVTAIRAGGGQALAVQADVSKEADVARLFQAADAAFGPPHVLVNNAGVVDRQARVDAMSEARLTRMFAINVIGSMLCAGAGYSH